jgi:hypothetical protein
MMLIGLLGVVPMFLLLRQHYGHEKLTPAMDAPARLA